MNAKSRRRIEMGTRALDFSRAHPDGEPGLRRRGDAAGGADAGGPRRQLRKRELRRTMRRATCRTWPGAKVAARERAGAGPEVRARPAHHGPTSAFRTAARGMAAEAQIQKEVLVKHGLVETVLDNLVQALDQFDAAVEQRGAGPARRTSAPARSWRRWRTRSCRCERDGRPQPVPVITSRSCWRRGRARATWSRRREPPRGSQARERRRPLASPQGRPHDSGAGAPLRSASGETAAGR